jgi:hypothetical protein
MFDIFRSRAPGHPPTKLRAWAAKRTIMAPSMGDSWERAYATEKNPHNAARDRNISAIAHQVNPKSSPIGLTINRFAG